MAYCARCGSELPVGSIFCPKCGAPVAPTSQAAAEGRATGAPLSGFDAVMKETRAQGYWIRRLVAFIIDAIIVGATLAITTTIMAIPLLFAGGFAAVVALFAGVFTIVSGVVLVAYFAVAEVASAASIGKHIMGLRVRTTSGKALTFAETLLRNISKVYWILLLLDVVVGLATSKGYTQKLSDRFIGTDVVSVAAPTPTPS